jgi:hypothetical protein
MPCSGRVTIKYAVSRAVVPAMVRVRVIRTAWAACGKPNPPGVCTVTALTVRVSARPCTRLRVRCPTGTCAQGSVRSWCSKLGWLAFTVTIRCPPRAATA